jgi:hypothetical protein
MRIGQIFRMSRPYSPEHKTVDGLPNYFYHTHTLGEKLPLLESGISSIGKPKSHLSVPAILLSSSPHRIGSLHTPWQDFFDPDNGYIRYFGDNKTPGKDPSKSKGNKALLDQFNLFTSPNKTDRAKSCPIVCFERVPYNGRVKGNIKFQGFGIVSRAERITQFDRNKNHSFSNYVFDITIFNLSGENEILEWEWISARRNSKLNVSQTSALAPKAWKIWVNEGNRALERCKRRVSKLVTYNKEEQKLTLKSKEASILNKIYSFYGGKSRKNSRFEALASIVAERIINGNGQSYRHGWITSATGDGGADFIGRLDIGSDLACTKLVVLGQAKCEKPDKPTGGNHIARTVARLRRGWIGVYVTTSYFSESVQREVWQDKYPIILINGKRLAEEVMAFAYESGEADIESFLKTVDQSYDSQIAVRDPEEILFD